MPGAFSTGSGPGAIDPRHLLGASFTGYLAALEVIGRLRCAAPRPV